jgi:exodeoxyribonuclease V alpha subunit
VNRDFELEGPAEVTGTVVKVVFSNPDTYWTVLSVAPDSGSAPVTVVGVMAGLRENERVHVSGYWEHEKRGWRIRMERYRIALPASRDGIERYLSSGLIPGVGKQTARLLVKRFGDQTLDIIRDYPERLRTVKGIGQKKIAELSRAFREHAGYAELLAYLQGIGVSISLARKIHQALGDDAVGRLRANPWSLAEVIDGIGFRRADDIATGLGLSGDHPERVAAGLLHALEEARREGHVALPRSELIPAAADLLAVTVERVEPILDVLLVGGRAVLDRGLVYLPPLHRAETRVCRNLAALLTGLGSRVPDGLVALHVAQAQNVLGVMLAPEQLAAVEMVIAAPVGVVTGGPGTGKTTTVRAIVTAFETLGKKVLLAAPTGRAA